MPAKSHKPAQLERDWDPTKVITVHNRSDQNILLNLPTGHFRLDAGRSFRMISDITDVQQVKELIAAGLVQVSKS
ncbi:MAG: hypothetical protein ABTQ73_05260 [Caldilineales bacterium]